MEYGGYHFHVAAVVRFALDNRGKLHKLVGCHAGVTVSGNVLLGIAEEFAGGILRPHVCVHCVSVRVKIPFKLIGTLRTWRDRFYERIIAEVVCLCAFDEIRLFADIVRFKTCAYLREREAFGESQGYGFAAFWWRRLAWQIF